MTDLAGRIRSFNQRLASLWGIPEDLLNERNDEAVQAWMRRSIIVRTEARLSGRCRKEKQTHE